MVQRKKENTSTMGAVVEGFMEHSKDFENTTLQQFSSLVKILLMWTSQG